MPPFSFSAPIVGHLYEGLYAQMQVVAVARGFYKVVNYTLEYSDVWKSTSINSPGKQGAKKAYAVLQKGSQLRLA